MIALIQRVNYASVSVNNSIVGEISSGVLAFVAVEAHDTKISSEKMIEKIVNYRIFSDESGKMNHSLLTKQGDLLLVSQFTLLADTTKGRRPSFSRSPDPSFSHKLFNDLLSFAREHPIKVASGEFGADMKVLLENDGPVTFWLEI